MQVCKFMNAHVHLLSNSLEGAWDKIHRVSHLRSRGASEGKAVRAARLTWRGPSDQLYNGDPCEGRGKLRRRGVCATDQQVLPRGSWLKRELLQVSQSHIPSAPSRTPSSLCALLRFWSLSHRHMAMHHVWSCPRVLPCASSSPHCLREPQSIHT